MAERDDETINCNLADRRAALLDHANLGAAEEVSSLRGHAVTDDSDRRAEQADAGGARRLRRGLGRTAADDPPPDRQVQHRPAPERLPQVPQPRHLRGQGAPVVADSHFFDRDGNPTEKVATRRYFCTQCHAAQAGAMPLVENVFPGR
jgi:cytochrome c-type protein NapB